MGGGGRRGPGVGLQRGCQRGGGGRCRRNRWPGAVGGRAPRRCPVEPDMQELHDCRMERAHACVQHDAQRANRRSRETAHPVHRALTSALRDLAHANSCHSTACHEPASTFRVEKSTGRQRRWRYVAFFLLLLAQVVGALATNPEEAEPEPALCIDRLRHTIHPPAGVRVAFRVLQCDDSPVRALTDAISVINDEKRRAASHLRGWRRNVATADFSPLSWRWRFLDHRRPTPYVSRASSFGDHPQHAARST